MEDSPKQQEQSKEGTLAFELEGDVFIVEKDAEGNITSREKLDGEIVLQSLVNVLERSLFNK